jgi:arabinose-5-phosphate isomerase
MAREADAIRVAADRLCEADFHRVVDFVLQQKGKVVVSGLGKSGFVAQKIVATLCSTGTPAVFLHPAEALHGDLGVYQGGDVTILISKSGATTELLRLVPLLRQFRSPTIGILGNSTSALAQQVDVVLDATVAREADPCDVAPTSSSAVALAIGDALASALMVARGFTADDFARFHPGGQLGRNLLLKVEDVMHRGDAVAWVFPDDSLKSVVLSMTRHALGAACVVDSEGRLEGLITEGDLRRAIQTNDDIRGLSAKQIMTRRPTVVTPDVPLKEALRLMENRPSQVSVLPVVEAATNRCLGLIRIHDIYQPSP